MIIFAFDYNQFNMRYLLQFLGSELRFAVYSFLISLVFAIFSGHGSTYWERVLYGSLGFFAFLNIYGLASAIVYWVRCSKDPVFKEMSIRTGISWKDYKNIKKRRDNNF